MNIHQIAILLVALTVVISFSIAYRSASAKIKVATVKCTDLLSGDTVVCKVKYTGIMTPLNRNAVLQYAKDQLEIGGVVANELMIVN